MNKEVELELLEEIESISFLFDNYISIIEIDGRAFISGNDKKIDEYAASKLESVSIDGTRYFDPVELKGIFPKSILINVLTFE